MIALAATLLADGCGFRPRGAAALPPAMAATYLDVEDTRGQFRRELRSALMSNGIQVVSDRSAATAVLEVPIQRLRRQVLSVGARARAREFELVYNVQFTLRDLQGDPLFPTQDLELRRDYTFDEQQVLGTTGEEQIIREDLRRDMVRQILLRLESI